MSKLIQNPRECLWGLFFGLFSISSLAGGEIPVTLQVNGKTQEIHAYSAIDLARLKTRSGKEKRPTGEVVNFGGPVLQGLMDESLMKLPLEVRAQIDLVVLGGREREALVPRSFINKFPVVLSKTKGGFESVVVGWQTNPKIKAEELPTDTYFLDSVQKITFTSYRERYLKYFLKRRTDPAAMRGEKVFTQACLGCHATGIGPDPSKWTTVEFNGMKKNAHPAKSPRFELNDWMVRALTVYWSAQEKERQSQQTKN